MQNKDKVKRNQGCVSNVTSSLHVRTLYKCEKHSFIFFKSYLLACDTISAPLTDCPPAHKLWEVHNTCWGVTPQVRKGEELLKQNKENNSGLQDLRFAGCQSSLLFLCFGEKKSSPTVSQEETAARTDCLHLFFLVNMGIFSFSKTRWFTPCEYAGIWHQQPISQSACRELERTPSNSGTSHKKWKLWRRK